MNKKGGLGKGLGAIFGENNNPLLEENNVKVEAPAEVEIKSEIKTKDNADITNNDKNHGNKNITEEGQNMEKEAESQKIISEQDPILDGGKKRVKEPVPEK